MEYILMVLAIIAFIILVLGGILMLGKNILLMFLEILNVRYLFRTLKPKYKQYLREYFSFYRILSDKDKDLFERRVQHFINSKNFIPRGGLATVSDQVKALTAGAAVQITFGFPEVYLNHFHKILVYPNSYYSNITKQHHFGEVNPRGIIVLSQKNLLHGFSDPDDGLNLAIHEMAHAIKLQSLVKNEKHGFLDQNVLRQIKLEGQKERIKYKNGKAILFRKYALTNFSEFFAVCLENFFERPDAFMQYNNTLYQLLVELLRVNPAKGRIEP